MRLRCQGTLCLVVIAMSRAVALSETVTFGAGDNQFEMEFVIIGNPGNAPDGMGDPGASLGAVPYTYRMAKFEVSQDMVDKVNALTAIDGAPLELYTLTSWAQQPTLDFYGISDPHQPAIGVSWVIAARFVNWLNVSSGYSPAYSFATQPEDFGNIDYIEYLKEDASMWSPDDRGFDRSQPYRNRFARFVIPSLDEWYKAAYHDASSGTEAIYFNFATGSDEAPTPVASGTEPGTAVYGQLESQGPAIVAEAGGPSTYGTVGQGGNAYEHQESFLRIEGTQLHSWTRGGSWGSNLLSLSTDSRFGVSPSCQDSRWGMRVAMLNPLGDFDENGAIAAADIDLLSEAVSYGSAKSVYDLDQDDIVDLADHEFWAEEIAGTRFGDADLNGTVEFADFLQLTANFGQATGWGGGDFDGNGIAEFSDFLLLSENFGKTGVAAVPEPTAESLVLLLFAASSVLRRRR